MFPELELTSFGDFIVRKEYVQDYEIIDVHTHTFSSVSGMLPALFRRNVCSQIEPEILLRQLGGPTIPPGPDPAVFVHQLRRTRV